MTTPDAFAKLTLALEQEAKTSPDPALIKAPAQHFSRTLSDAKEHLRDLVKGHKAVLVFVDGRAKACLESKYNNADNEIRGQLCSMVERIAWVDVSELLGVPAGDVHASASYLPKIREALHRAPAGPVLVLGSGSLTDLVKHTLFEDDAPRPFISLPTALTVTAFTSKYSVLDWNGAKRTKDSRVPDATLWIAPILRAAPARLNRSGYGDLLAKFFAYGDWYLAKFFGMSNTYNELAFHLMDHFASELRDIAGAIAEPSSDGSVIENAAAVLAMAGVAMNVAGETSPLSGFDHVVSHGLDFLRYQSGRPLALHGEQVALGCLASAACFDWLLNTPAPKAEQWRFQEPADGLAILDTVFESAPLFGPEELLFDPGARQVRLNEISSSLAEARKEFRREFSGKAKLWKDIQPRIPELTERWEEMQSEIRRLTLRTSEIESILRQSSLPMSPEELDPAATAAELRWALRFSPFVRKRMSIGDLCFWLGEDPAILAAT